MNVLLQPSPSAGTLHIPASKSLSHRALICSGLAQGNSTLSHLMFSIPAVKGISFGEGFGFAHLYGSQANDPIIIQDGVIQTQTNRNGGINGGISNGMPIVFQTCIKPTPSIYQPQHSVNYQTKEDVILEIKGRHDPAIIHRARAVVDALSAFGLLDLWMSHQATTSFEA